VRCFQEHGYCVLRDVLGRREACCTTFSTPASTAAWGIDAATEVPFFSSDEPTGRRRGVKGKLAQLLVGADKLDWCARLPIVVPTVDALFGGDVSARFGSSTCERPQPSKNTVKSQCQADCPTTTTAICDSLSQLEQRCILVFTIYTKGACYPPTRSRFVTHPRVCHKATIPSKLSHGSTVWLTVTQLWKSFPEN
jgi:hypothetical protein